MRKIILFLLVFLLAAFPGCTQEPAETTASLPTLLEPAGSEAMTTPAYIGPMYKLDMFQGSMMAYTEGLSTEIDGTIAKLYFYPGKRVEKDEILLELDSEAIQSQITALEEALAEAEKENDYTDRLAQLQIDILEVELQQLQAQQAEQKQIDLKKNEIAQAKADLRQAQKLRQPDLDASRQEIAKLKTQLEKTVLRAPFAGRIIRGTYNVGDRVTAEIPFLYIADDTQLTLSCEFISDPVLESAHRIFARIGATDYDIQAQPLDLEEYYAMIAADVDPVRRFDVVGPQEQLDTLEAGQFAAVCVISDYIEAALIVPTESVFEENGQTYVYVDENGAKALRPVTVGASVRGMTQILEGLEEGEDVYVAEE